MNLEKIKKTRAFVDNIRWDITPKIFIEPRSGAEGKPVDTTEGYMLYVDIILERPAVVIMVLKPMMSKTAGYIYDVPLDMLKESMQCPDESVAGMYPLSEKLELWLKKEFGLTG